MISENIDVTNIDHVLHVLRNPYGWNEHVRRDVRLAAADEIERLQAAVAAARQEERERCAKLCDAADKSTHPSDLADAIRQLSDSQRADASPSK